MTVVVPLSAFLIFISEFSLSCLIASRSDLGMLGLGFVILISESLIFVSSRNKYNHKFIYLLELLCIMINYFNSRYMRDQPTSWTQHDTLQETIAFADKRKSLLVIQIQEAL